MLTKNQTSTFPWVTFTCSRQNKTFCIPIHHVLHTEDFQYEDENKQTVVDEEKTYVNFTNPNPTKKMPLHAVVDMPIRVFRDVVLRPAFTQEEASNV